MSNFEEIALTPDRSLSSPAASSWLLGADAIDVDRALAQLASDGYARLGRVLSDAGVQALGERLSDIMMARVTYDGMFFQHDSSTGRYEDLQFGAGWQGPSLAYRKLEKLEMDPLFSSWIQNPLFERIARQWIAEPTIALYRAVVFSKRANGGTVLPWHQDGGAFWGVDRAPTLQIWTALDDASEAAGCVELIPQTHLRGLATPQGGTISEALVAPELRRAIKLPATAGEALLIHNHTWHRSGVNETPRRRAALSACFMSGATTCRRARRAPRKFVRMFEGQLNTDIQPRTQNGECR